MNRLSIFLVLTALCLGVSLPATSLRAQVSGLRPYKPASKDRAKAEAAKGGAAEGAKTKTDGEEAKTEPTKAAADDKAAPPPPAPPETDPLVLAVLASNPQSPVELVQAASVLVSRRRAPLAKPLVERLVAAKLSPDQLRALARRFGPGTILQLGLAPELAPAGRQFADAVDAALQAGAADPARVGRLVDQLAAPTLDERRAAAFQLRDIGPAAAVPLVKILADPAQAARHPLVREALVAMGDQMIPPLVGALDARNAALSPQLIDVLGQLAPGEAGPYVLGAAADAGSPATQAAALEALERWKGSAVTPDEAREALEREVRLWFDEKRLPPANVNGLVTVWRWDPSVGAAAPLEATPRQAADLRAARLTADLAAADPSPENRLKALVAGLQVYAPGPTLDQTPAEELDAALALALQTGRWTASATLADALGRSGWQGAVAGRSGEPAPLALAARTSDRALNRAAVGAVLAIDPRDPFTGAGAVSETLRFLATGRGDRIAVVAHPRLDDGRNLGAWLAARGYQPIIVATGAEAYQAAVASADVELVLLHSALSKPCACDVIKNLRRDRRTATLPIGLMQLPPIDRSPLDEFERDPYSIAGIVPVEEPIFGRFLERLLIKAGAGVTPPDVRREQGDFAVAGLARLVESPRPWFDLRSAEGALLARLDQGEPGPATIGALGLLGTPRAQRRLVELVANSLAPAEERQQALDAFIESIRRHGILLEAREIEQEYARYNASDEAAPEERQILAALLEALEAPRAAAAAAANGN
ncbi:MAG: hypothetical protein U0836_13870 [Pirellulales bacterium]